MRLIDADALLKDISAAKECGGMDEIVAGTLRRYILRQPVIAHPNKWISTDKRTPQFMKLERWSMHVDHEWCQSCKINPAYWMPLPKPPKGSEDVAFSATTESGCEYCSGDPMRPLDWQYGLDHIFPDYKYCPMCGRRVRGDEMQTD